VVYLALFEGRDIDDGSGILSTSITSPWPYSTCVWAIERPGAFGQFYDPFGRLGPHDLGGSIIATSSLLLGLTSIGYLYKRVLYYS
jgi:hypothetical protein